MQGTSERSQLLRVRNGRVFSDVEREVLNDVTGAVAPAESVASIPSTFRFLTSTDPWLTDRQLVLLLHALVLLACTSTADLFRCKLHTVVVCELYLCIAVDDTLVCKSIHSSSRLRPCVLVKIEQVAVWLDEC